MPATTVEAQHSAACEKFAPVARRSRKHTQVCLSMSMLELQQLVEQTGHGDLVLGMARAASQMAAEGRRCESLRELAERARSDRPAPTSGPRAKAAVLQRLIQEASAVAAELGAEVEQSNLRALYFGFSRCCQRVSAELRRAQLWTGDE